MVIIRKAVAGATELSLSRFLNLARRAAGVTGQVNLLITSSRELRSLNRRFRRLDKATDVLSFPAAAPPGEPDGLAGDIAISAEIACRNARALGHASLVELKILALHGVLHLAGCDHEKDNGEMARRERRLRRALRLPDGLIERTAAVPLQEAKARRMAAKGGGGRT